MNPRQIAKWEKLRAMGRRKFIRRYGVLGWGLTSGIAFSSMMLYEFKNSDLRPEPAVAAAILGVPIFMCGGILFGWGMWMLLEWRYQRAVQAAG